MTDLVKIAPPNMVLAAVHHPAVKPHLIGHFDSVDLSTYFSGLMNVSLCAGPAVALFPAHPKVRNGYDSHYAFPPVIRGKAAGIAARAMLDFMFTNVGAEVIYGTTPRDNRAARLMNAKLGFIPLTTTVDTLDRECIFYELRKERWVR
jgi:hypothetical protein